MPLLSAGLCALACLLMWLPGIEPQALYFNRAALAGGNPGGLISGHWIHADPAHLAWNVAALAILATVIEARSRILLLCSLVAGMSSVNLLLLLCDELQRYCGLSGVLNTLLGVALYCQWRESRSVLVIAAALLAAGKIAIEMFSGHSVVTSISWPPYPAAHLAGLLATPLAVALADGWHAFKKRPMSAGAADGHTVTGR